MRKQYHIPMVEIMVMKGIYPMMAIAESKEYWPAPERREPAF